MCGMNQAVVPQIPPEETKRSHINIRPVSLVSFSSSLPTCILSGPLSRDITHKTSSYKEDIHTYKVNFTLKIQNSLSWDCAACKTGNSLFSFQMCTHRADIFFLLGRKKWGVLWVTRVCFFLHSALGQHNCAIHFKGPPDGMTGAKQEKAKGDAFMSKPSFQSLLWHNGDTTSHRNKLVHRDT